MYFSDSQNLPHETFIFELPFEILISTLFIFVCDLRAKRIHSKNQHSTLLLKHRNYDPKKFI